VVAGKPGKLSETAPLAFLPLSLSIESGKTSGSGKEEVKKLLFVASVPSPADARMPLSQFTTLPLRKL
jgi:hypothetical protein